MIGTSRSIEREHFPALSKELFPPLITLNIGAVPLLRICTGLSIDGFSKMDGMNVTDGDPIDGHI